MPKLFSLLVVITLSSQTCHTCRTPTAPSPDATPWDCERVLTHPIRQTFVQQCTHPITGAVEIRDDN